ncbi:hypothetical protein Hanom_Chr12g01159721 [Helianthus anomalus]
MNNIKFHNFLLGVSSYMFCGMLCIKPKKTTANTGLSRSLCYGSLLIGSAPGWQVVVMVANGEEEEQ